MSATSAVIEKLMNYADTLIAEGRTDELLSVTSRIESLEKSNHDTASDEAHGSSKAEKRNMTVSEAAEIMGKSQMFVRIGLQRGLLPFGTAVKMSKTWTYYISPEKFYNYVGYVPGTAEN